jgi:tRNA threonylcarbamoyladenosine biosynthesis protein TsaB
MSDVSEVVALSAKPIILAIDTSTERLGVALLHGDVCAYRHLQLGTGHANQVLGVVEELLQECGINRAALDAIAVCRGPGGFTGLRIAIGVAQGLALALDRPVVPVSGLRVLAAAASGFAGPPEPPEPREPREPPESMGATAATRANAPGPVVAVIDARMGEFYAAAWKDAAAAWAGAAPLFAEALLKPESLIEQVGQFVGPGVIALAAAGGSGKAQVPDGSAERSRSTLMGAEVEATWPDARVLAWLGRQGLLAGEGVPAEAAQPVYLRDQVAVPSVVRLA